MGARLIVEAGNAEPRICDLSPDQITRVGRNRRSDLILLDHHASRHHAELYRDDGGRWFLRDCDSTNHTQIDGAPVERPTPLRHGQIIVIGEARLRFSLGDDPTPPALPALPAGLPVPDESTRLLADELTALFGFMTASLQATSAASLIDLALAAVQRQTRADLCGFLSLDAKNPLPRVVRPARITVDVHLSRRLTQQVRQEGRTARLTAAGAAGADGDSLDSYHDALCVPLRGTPTQPAGDETPLGALHVYRAVGLFLEREVRFCEVLGRCLADNLLLLRARYGREADITRLRVRAVDGEELIGPSPTMESVRQQIDRLGACPSGILILGESGVGKELAALALHRGSSRRDGPLVIVNCAAIVQSMPEAQLFGHVRGAFTGADCARPGYFRQADLGTLFLDEIGELTPEVQAKLLRAIETQSFDPVGASEPVQVDVRVLAATNRNLERAVAEGKFRGDLLFRLGIHLKIPPLRERREDIPILADYLLEHEAERYGRRARLAPAAVEHLQAYDWPGNVRELRTVLERALALSDNTVLQVSDLRLTRQPAATPDLDAPPTSLNLAELESWAIRQALRRTDGNIKRAAEILDLHRDTLALKIRKYGIDNP